MAAQDLLIVKLANEKLLNATNEILASAYELNKNLRIKSFEQVPELLVKFSQTDVNLFNATYNEFIQTVSNTNTVEILILAAIGTNVSIILLYSI